MVFIASLEFNLLVFNSITFSLEIIVLNISDIVSLLSSKTISLLSKEQYLEGNLYGIGNQSSRKV